eukprot:8578139-Ditylum_brightwellii.AAC.1
MREKLRSTGGFDMVSKEDDAIELLKAIKSTVFRFNNKCDVHIAIRNIINRFWHFYQARDMSNLAYCEKFRNLIEVAEEHRANLCLHPKLINTEAADVESPTDEEKDTAKDKFQGRMFIIKACQFCYQKLKEELHNGLTQ